MVARWVGFLLFGLASLSLIDRANAVPAVVTNTWTGKLDYFAHRLDGRIETYRENSGTPIPGFPLLTGDTFSASVSYEANRPAVETAVVSQGSGQNTRIRNYARYENVTNMTINIGGYFWQSSNGYMILDDVNYADGRPVYDNIAFHAYSPLQRISNDLTLTGLTTNFSWAPFDTIFVVLELRDLDGTVLPDAVPPAMPLTIGEFEDSHGGFGNLRIFLDPGLSQPWIDIWGEFDGLNTSIGNPQPPSPIPTPQSLWLFALGAAGLGLALRQKRAA